MNIPNSNRKNYPIIDLAAVLAKYIYHWPLFIISIIICLAGAFFISKLNKPIYEVKATLLIKDEKKTPDQQIALREIDVFNSSTVTENEVEILKSKEIINKVVNELQLNINYFIKDRVLSKDLYGISPVKLILVDSNIRYDKPTLDIIIKDNKSFFLVTVDAGQKEILFDVPFKTAFAVVKLQATKELPLYVGKEIKIALSDPDVEALSYQDKIDVNLPNKLASAVVLTLNDPIPQRGKDVLNHVILSYKAAGVEEKKREIKNTLGLIDRRLDSLAHELTFEEKGIEQFKSTRGLTDINSQSQINLENKQANDSRLNDVNVQLSIIEGIERYINATQNAGKAPSTQGITDPTLGNSIERLADLELQRDRLLATTPETNPVFESITRQIVTTKAAIKETVKNIKLTLTNTQQKLESFNSNLSSSIKSIPTQEREYINIKRQQASKEVLYTYLLQKREEISVNYATTVTDNRVVDSAYAGLPKHPSSAIIFALGLLLGILVPTGIVYKKTGGKITNLDEIEGAVSADVLAELPFDASQQRIVVNKDPTVVSELFRTLRTKIFYLLGEGSHGKIILITSSVSGEGKSFVSSNLSTALISAGRKTILLELDMRKPKIANIFGLSKTSLGISDFVLGKATKTDIIQTSKLVPGLDIISCGSFIENPSELLEQKVLKDLIISLRDSYDTIVVDSPPIHLVPDAMVTSYLADITLYVIRQGWTEKTELRFIEKALAEKILPNVQLIFNGIRKKHGYAYSYDTSYYTNSNKKVSGSIFSNFLKRF
jgi:tyrosine-protein kinase Etk/Wzc